MHGSGLQHSSEVAGVLIRENFIDCYGGMRDTYKKQADVLVEDARNHFKQREQELDTTIEQRANEKAYDLVSGPYRQEEDSEKPTHEPMETIDQKSIDDGKVWVRIRGTNPTVQKPVSKIHALIQKKTDRSSA